MLSWENRKELIMPETTYLIADTHFGDAAILRYESRPFQSVEEMDEAIIRNWNSTVKEGDTVFVLGDFSAYALPKTADICQRLNGHKYLIMGNHDTASESDYLACGFAHVSRHPIIYENFWMLSHEPLYINRNMPYANIFGHVHDNPMYRTDSPQSFCACVERIGYTPIGFSEVRQRIMDACQSAE